MSSLKHWWLEVALHDDFLNGKVDEALFAADLSYVTRGEGQKVYQDSETFFQRTYLTDGLKNLLKAVLLRVKGQSEGKAVINLQTPFGGGKTHSLMALYHLFSQELQIDRLPAIKKLLSEVGLDNVPCPKVAVLIGTSLKVLGEEKPDGTLIRTLWGELVYQLGGSELFSKIQKYDEQLVAPGTKDLAEIFKKADPVVILIDEILTYISLIGKQKHKENIISTEQILAFFQVLTIAISNSSSSSLIITFPQTQLERFGEEAENALNKLIKIFGRLKHSLTPIEGIEVFDVIKTRLFQSLGNSTVHRETVESYWEFYQAHRKELPTKLQYMSKNFSYKDLMLKAYPFHPELIEIFQERWGKIPNFQSTRGLLRLLTLCTIHLSKNKRPGALILPSHVDLSAESIRKEILEVVGFSFKRTIEMDIAGPTSTVKRLDQSLGSEFVDIRLTEGLATSIFLYSHPSSSNGGITESYLRLAVYQPEIFPSLVSDVILKLTSKREGLWYLYKNTAGLFQFKDQINLIGLSIAYRERVSKDKIQTLIDKTVKVIIGDKKIFNVYIYPNSQAEVPDTRQKIHQKSHLSLVILSFEQSLGSESEKEIKGQIDEIYNFKGRSKTPRDYRNSLVFITPSKTGYNLVERTAREIIAFQMIEDAENDRLSSRDLETLKQWLKESKNQLPQVILSSYRHILVGGKDGNLRHWDLGPHAYEVNLHLTERVFQFLLAQEKLLEKLDPKLLVSKRWNLWSDPQKALSVMELWEMFARYTYLPMLASKKVLEKALTEGVSQGLFLVGVGKGNQMSFERIFYQTKLEEPLLVSEKIWLIQKGASFKTRCPQCQNWIEIKDFSTFICPNCSDSSSNHMISLKKREEISSEPIISVQSPDKVYEVTLETFVSKQDWQSFLRGVLNPLISEADHIEIQIKVSAHEGFNKNTLDLAVKETITQLNLKAKLKTK
ncbi:MAG: ATP-binding protein [Candidatus Hermodarchaeota archaeon]